MTLKTLTHNTTGHMCQWHMHTMLVKLHKHDLTKEKNVFRNHKNKTLIPCGDNQQESEAHRMPPEGRDCNAATKQLSDCYQNRSHVQMSNMIKCCSTTTVYHKQLAHSNPPCLGLPRFPLFPQSHILYEIFP